MSIKIYAAPRTRGVRIVWLLEELQLAYDLEVVEFVPTTNQFFIQPTPTGKVPTLVDGELVMAESGAMVEYLLERYGEGRLAPAVGDPRRGTYLQWLHFAESTAFAPMGVLAWLTRYRDDAHQHPQLVEDGIARAKQTLAHLQQELGPGPYLLGDEFSAADIMMGFTLAAAASMDLLGELPDLNAYFARLAQRPAFARAMATLGS